MVNLGDARSSKRVESLLPGTSTVRHRPFPLAPSLQQGAYENMYRKSIEESQQYWSGRASELLHWYKKWDSILEGDFTSPEIKWFAGAELNASYNCLDRHLEMGRRNKAALIWQGEREQEVRVFTYQMLHSEVCRFANILKKKGVKKGDCVSIYLPMIPELVVAMLASARIGAVHSVVFSGFSSASLLTRVKDCGSKVLITSDAVFRAGRAIPLKPNADEVLEECDHVTSCIVVRRGGRDVSMTEGRDTWWSDEMAAEDVDLLCEPVKMSSDDTLFALYTSGSTGKPKKVMHTTGGYLTYALHTSKLVFDLQEDDIFWCTADIGWMTGHSYIVYGPLGLGTTVVMYEGMPLYPEPDRFWWIVEKFRISIFYTAPTVIRALMYFGNGPVEKHDISSLRLLGSVGEPINPEAWHWYHEYVGGKQLPILDTWWQTETGGIMVSPLPDTVPLKPGSAVQPLPGIEIDIVNASGEKTEVNEVGRLLIKKPWPGMLKEQNRDSGSIYGKDGYDTGDGALYDEDGYVWMMGRVDDVINVEGQRIGTAEVESALLTHRSVAEAAVVGKPDSLKGQAIYAYVTLNRNVEQTEELLRQLREHVCEKIGSIASPDTIQYVTGLPKTRSGKIMRRILKKIAADEHESFGDISTLADPSLLADLVEGKKHIHDEKTSTGA